MILLPARGSRPVRCGTDNGVVRTVGLSMMFEFGPYRAQRPGQVAFTALGHLRVVVPHMLVVD